MMHTQRGIFGATGNGNGIFATTVSGVRGLGAVDPFAAVPAPCWDKPGFKDCSAAASQAATNDLYKIQADEPSFKPDTPAWKEQYPKIWAIYLQSCVTKAGCGTTAVTKPASSSSSSKAPVTTTSIPEDAYMAADSPAWGKWAAIAGGALVAAGVGYWFLRKKKA